MEAEDVSETIRKIQHDVVYVLRLRITSHTKYRRSNAKISEKRLERNLGQKSLIKEWLNQGKEPTCQTIHKSNAPLCSMFMLTKEKLVYTPNIRHLEKVIMPQCLRCVDVLLSSKLRITRLSIHSSGYDPAKGICF